MTELHASIIRFAFFIQADIAEAESPYGSKCRLT